MHRLWLAALLTCGGLLAAQPAVANQFPAGLWLTEDHEGVIAVAPCGANICGRIAGITLDHPNDPPPTDWRGRPQCGEQIITAAPDPHDANKWLGTVMDPRSGSVWQAELTLDGGTLRLRGYLGLPIFGETESWQAFTGQIAANCMFRAP